MNQKNKSSSKLSPVKLLKNRTHSKEEGILKIKRDQIVSANKSSKSTKSLTSKSNLTKSTKRPIKQQVPQSATISKEYTKSTFYRYQQKLSIEQKIIHLINEIGQRESCLNSYFEIYRLLESEVGQQRCLEHNNDLSLYCLNENKVLCVHCVYGQTKHKTHKVLPLKDCLRDVSMDNNRLQQMIKRDLDTTKLKIKTSEMNQKFIDRHFRQQLQELQRIYVQKLKNIQIQFCEKKAYVTDYFESIKKESSQLTKILRDFENNVCIKLSILEKQPHLAKHDSKQVSRQTILSKISQLSDLSGVVLEDLNEKDIAQNCMRYRMNRTTKK